MPQEMNPSKEDIRTAHRRRRALRTEAELEAAGSALARHGNAWAASVTAGQPGTVCVYLGVGKEPPTMPLVKALHGSGHEILLPVCEPGRELSWVFWTPDTGFERSSYAPILEPTGRRHGREVAAAASALIIPATAVDLSGNRIGQGGGYYDTFLGHLSAVGKEIPLAAVIYDDELLPAGRIPAEEFDRSVPGVLLPSGYRRLSGGN